MNRLGRVRRGKRWRPPSHSGEQGMGNLWLLKPFI